MPKRSLGVREIRFRTANVSEDKAESFAPCDIEGQSLLDIFEHWCEELRGSTHVRKEAEECVLVKRIQMLDAETLLVDTLSGKMGEEGEVLAQDDAESKYHISYDEAPTGHTRCLLIVPEEGESALLFSEVCHRGSSGPVLLRDFRAFFRREFPKVNLLSSQVKEGGEWLKQVESIKEYKIVIQGLPKNSYGVLGSRFGQMSLTLKPDRRKTFPFFSEQKIRKVSAGDLVGAPDLDDIGPSRVKATLEGADGREKTIDLDKPDLPYFLRTLTESGEPELTDKQFVQRCRGYALEIFKRLGVV